MQWMFNDVWIEIQYGKTYRFHQFTKVSNINVQNAKLSLPRSGPWKITSKKFTKALKYFWTYISKLTIHKPFLEIKLLFCIGKRLSTPSSFQHQFSSLNDFISCHQTPIQATIIAKICPFCQKIFGKDLIKDHIGQYWY